MDYELEPFERANKMIAAIPAAILRADASPEIDPVTLNLNRIEELMAKVKSVSSSLNRKAVSNCDFSIINQLSAVDQQTEEITSRKALEKAAEGCKDTISALNTSRTSDFRLTKLSSRPHFLSQTLSNDI